MTINKTLVKEQFSSRINTYSDEAVIQRNIASKLVFMLKELQPRPFSNILEIGCGTGFLTKQLIENLTIDQLFTNDITNSAQEKINKIAEQYGITIPFLCGDAEETVFPQNLDAVFSTSTIQWFRDLKQFFTQVNDCLTPNGIFAFSTFGPDNFMEINSLTGVGLKYHSSYKISSMLSSKFQILSTQEWIEKKEFKHPIHVLRHIKLTGVNAIRKIYLGKEHLQEFVTNYSRRFTTSSQTVTLTYHPIIVVARKKQDNA
jgi:malonyl-CoA O-methyltransferase